MLVLINLKSRLTLVEIKFRSATTFKVNNAFGNSKGHIPANSNIFLNACVYNFSM